MREYEENRARTVCLARSRECGLTDSPIVLFAIGRRDCGRLCPRTFSGTVRRRAKNGIGFFTLNFTGELERSQHSSLFGCADTPVGTVKAIV